MAVLKQCVDCFTLVFGQPPLGLPKVKRQGAGLICQLFEIHQWDPGGSATGKDRQYGRGSHEGGQHSSNRGLDSPHHSRQELSTLFGLGH